MKNGNKPSVVSAAFFSKGSPFQNSLWSKQFTFPTLWAFSADDKLMIFFLFFPRKQDLTFLANCLNLHEMSNPVFKMSSAGNFTQSAKR